MNEKTMKKIIYVVLALCLAVALVFGGIWLKNNWKQITSGGKIYTEQELLDYGQQREDAVKEQYSEYKRLYEEYSAKIELIDTIESQLAEERSKNEQNTTKIAQLQSSLDNAQSEVNRLQGLLQSYEGISTETYTITFYNGANVYTSRAVSVSNPYITSGVGTPKQDKRVFVGWALNSSDGEVIELESYRFTFSTNLYAVFEEKPLNDYTWEEIAQISESGQASQFFSVGDEKTFTLGMGEEITVAIMGFNHDNLSDGSGKAGITFGMTHLTASGSKMNYSETNVGGWNDSAMRKTLQNTYFTQMTTDLQNVIKAVDKKTTIGNKKITMTTSSDKLFLFSVAEIASATSIANSSSSIYSGYASTYQAEGTQYAYFRNLIGDADIYNTPWQLARKTKTATNTSSWWLRSADTTFDWRFSYIGHTQNAASGCNNANSNMGISFGFCI